MDVKLRYRGREVTTEDIDFLRRLVAENPTASRRELSRRVCDAWEWVQPNGTPCDMVCRGLMLALDRAELIKLPPRRVQPPNNAIRRRKPNPCSIDSRPIECALADLGPLSWRQVRRTEDEALFDALLCEHHYLGYTRPVGEHLKYMVRAQDRPIACLAWSSPPLRLGPRDRFLGWSDEARQRNLHLVAYNPRYLILPWVRVPHLASHLLGRMASTLSSDWEAAYGHPIYFVQTFVDVSRYKGTCYRAANWTSLGFTTGRGNNAWTKQQTRTIKEVLGYPLTKDFRRRLQEVR